MATTSFIPHDSATSNILSTNKTVSIHHLSRSLERALDEATYTGELVLNGRKLREFPNYSDINNKCDLSDTISAGLLLLSIYFPFNFLCLDLSRNQFTEFPRILCSFFSLERLNLYNNAIKFIPDQIIQIRMLKVLDLR